jgi:hypothetical protein
MLERKNSARYSNKISAGNVGAAAISRDIIAHEIEPSI